MTNLWPIGSTFTPQSRFGYHLFSHGFSCIFFIYPGGVLGFDSVSSYLLRRLSYNLLLLLILSFCSFALMGLMPGDPVDMLISSNPEITSDDIQRLRQLYGLDQPIYKRYWHWLTALFQGDLGYSRTYRIPVADIIGPRLINTAILSLSALLLALAIAIPLGILAALRAGTVVDYLINLFAFTGISIPSFFLAILLIIIFAIAWPILPAGGTHAIGEEAGGAGGFLISLKYLVLPTLSLSYLQAGTFIRFTRSAMIDSMRNEFIQTAKSKGLKPLRILLQHAFRNALSPLITLIALSLSSLFSGALITETVFAYQGVGKLVYDSIYANDFNVVMVAFMISTAMVLFMNLLADVLYALVDPRVCYV